MQRNHAMTHAISRPRRRALISCAVTAAMSLVATLASFTVTAAPAEAAARGTVHVAALASPLAEPRREIVDGVLWRCEGDRCTASVEGSRPVRICGRVAKKFGEVARFTSPEGELAAEDLARCNGKA
jgi:hypothetical protein